jgi:hypothetical protein
LTDILLMQKDDIFASFNCIKLGEIQSFSPTLKTAQVRVLFKRILEDKTVVSQPLLMDCPVFTLQGGGGAIRFPITKGDQCLLLFSDRSLDTWFKTGMESAPSDKRCHSLSDGIILVGMNAQTSTLPTYKTNEVELEYAAAVLGLKGGKFKLKNATTDLLSLLNLFFTALEGITDANNVPLSSASIAAIEAFKTQFATLLYST